MPSLQKLNFIIKQDLVTSKKDLVPIKLILDIYEHYYKTNDGPLYVKLIKEYIPIATKFYSKLSQTDISFIIDSLASEITLILSKKLQLHTYRRKNLWIKHLKDLQKCYEDLTRGLTSEMFYN